MEGEKRILLKGIVVACIFCLIIVAALVLSRGNTHFISANNGKDLSIVYFEGFSNGLKVVEFGKPVNFMFKVDNEEKVPMSYNYSIEYDNEQLRSGQINLQPKELSSIPVSFFPREATLVKIAETNVSVSRWRYNGRLSMLVEQGHGMGKVKVITSPQGYSMIYMRSNNSTQQIDFDLPNKVILPLKLQIGSLLPRMLVFIFDPNKKEFFTMNNSSMEQVGGPDKINPPVGNELSNFGYHIHHDVWTIENDHGDLDITRRYGSVEYRYAFKKVSAKVTEIRGGQVFSRKAIDSWVVVETNPDDLFS